MSWKEYTFKRRLLKLYKCFSIKKIVTVPSCSLNYFLVHQYYYYLHLLNWFIVGSVLYLTARDKLGSNSQNIYNIKPSIYFAQLGHHKENANLYEGFVFYFWWNNLSIPLLCHPEFFTYPQSCTTILFIVIYF